MKTSLTLFLTILFLNYPASMSMSPLATEMDNLVKRVKALEAGAKLLLPVYIRSEGCDDLGIIGCGRAFIQVNGKDYAKKKRGYNIVVLNGGTGKVECSVSFDTYGNSLAAGRMEKFLKGLPTKRFVLVAIEDSANARMTNSLYDALVKIGAVNPLKKFRSSFALIGWTGPGKTTSVTQVQRDRYKGPSIISTVITLPL